MVWVNVIPKRTSSTLGMSIRRMAGWSLVLAGGAYALAWLLLPLAWAGTTALAILLSATLFAIARTAWLLRRQRGLPPSQSG